MAGALHILDNGEYCWSSIGVFSRKAATCPLLARVIHCQNCDVYSAAGRTLFERAAPSGYAEEWTRLLRVGKAAEESESLSLLVFRIGAEWLALPTTALREVSAVKPVHSLPHRTDSLLLGLVNIRGQLQLCFSLATLLGLEANADEPRAPSTLAYRRMVVAHIGHERWVFAVDEIDGVRRFRPRHLRQPPATVTHVRARFSKSIVQYDEDVLMTSERSAGAVPFRARQVGQLDHERIFEVLRQHLQGGAVDERDASDPEAT